MKQITITNSVEYKASLPFEIISHYASVPRINFYDYDPNEYANNTEMGHSICSVLNSDNIRSIKDLHLYLDSTIPKDDLHGFL